jgi:integrase
LSIPHSIEPRPQKLLDRVREIIRIKHYSYRTEETYVFWVRHYILFHDKQHPKDMNSPEIEAFLSHLAIKENVAASTQNQALSALLFLYREVLNLELNAPVDAIRAKRPRYLPTVLTKEEVVEVIRHLSGTYQLVVQLLYGSGLRLSEALQLRIKDLDFA